MKFKIKNKKNILIIDLVILSAILCIILSYTFTQKVFAEEINAFQKFMVEALHLRNTPRNEMTKELDDYFYQDEYDIDEITQSIQPKYFLEKLSYDEVKEALIVFSERSSDGKTGLYMLINKGVERLEQNAMGDCINIVEKFNELMTGDPQNNKGISTIITLFRRTNDFADNDVSIFAQNGNPKTSIQFIFEGDDSDKLKASGAMNHFTSLVEEISSCPGANNFEKLLAYSQVTTNSETLYDIYAFKVFLKDNKIFNETPASIPDYAKGLSVTGRKFIDANNGTLFTICEGSIKSTAKIELNDSVDTDVQNVVYAIALYNRNTKKLIDFKSESFYISKGQEAVTFTTEPVLVKAPASDYLIKTFIWDGYNAMSPIGVIEILY